MGGGGGGMKNQSHKELRDTLPVGIADARGPSAADAAWLVQRLHHPLRAAPCS